MPTERLKGVCFSFDPREAHADWLFVYEGLSETLKTTIPKSHRVLACGEPASIKKYSKAFLAQFGAIWTTDSKMDHPSAIIHHPCCPWHVGAYANRLRRDVSSMNIFDLLQAHPEKKKLLSVVASNKCKTEGHRRRLAFVEALKREFGDEVEVFGRGLRDFEDKWDVLAEYKYHIAIENSAYPHYWTEKLSDPILTLTYPIYYGCPNISHYFKDDTLETIDIENPQDAIDTIKRVISEGHYERNVDHLRSAREDIIYKYSLFAEIARYVCDSSKPTASPLHKPESVRPEREYDKIGRFFRRTRSSLVQTRYRIPMFVKKIVR